MEYHFALSIPKLTSKDQPVSLVMDLAAGTIDFIEVEFPLRCAGLAHFYIKDKAWYLVPWNSSFDLYGDNRIFHVPMHDYPLIAPYILTAFGWNEDDTFSHQISIIVSMNETGINPLRNVLLKS